MKIYQLIVTVATAFTLFSCAAEDNNGLNKPTAPTGEPATLKLTITDPIARTRGTGGTADDDTLNNFTIFVFREDGDIDIRPQFYPKDAINLGSELSVSITNLAKQIHILANVDSLYADTTLLKITDLDSFKKFRINLGVRKTGTQNNENVFMRGSTNNIVWTGGTAMATVDLSYGAAKIEISNESKLANITDDMKDATWEYVVLNAPANTPLSETPITTGQDTLLYSGDVSYFNASDRLLVAEARNLIEKTSFNNGGGSTTAGIHFYVFPTDFEYNAKQLKTILTLRSSNTGSGATVYKYWSIKFDKIEAGKEYLVKYTIDGKSSVGTSDPEIVLKSSPFTATITKPLWAKEPIDTTWP